MPPRQLFVRSAGGFTLLELLVTLTILALVAAISVSRMGGVYQRTLVKTTITEIARLDDQARSFAVSRGAQVVLRVSLTEGKLHFESEGDDVGQPLWLPSSLSIERFISAREQKSSGVATVRIGKLGGSESYALKLSRSDSSAQWLFFSGGSGQCVLELTTREVEELFRVLKKNRPHAT